MNLKRHGCICGSFHESDTDLVAHLFIIVDEQTTILNDTQSYRENMHRMMLKTSTLRMHYQKAAKSVFHLWKLPD